MLIWYLLYSYQVNLTKPFSNSQEIFLVTPFSINRHFKLLFSICITYLDNKRSLLSQSLSPLQWQQLHTGIIFFIFEYIFLVTETLNHKSLISTGSNPLCLALVQQNPDLNRCICLAEILDTYTQKRREREREREGKNDRKTAVQWEYNFLEKWKYRSKRMFDYFFNLFWQISQRRTQLFHFTYKHLSCHICGVQLVFESAYFFTSPIWNYNVRT